MTQKTINVGTVANDGTGDTIRGAFVNVNANFTEVFGNISNLTTTLAGMDLGQNTTIQASYNTANVAFNKANSSNLFAYNIAISANLFSVDVGSAGNAYSVVVGASSNNWSNTLTSLVGAASNNYASILSANNAAGANAWANTVAVTTYGWANSTFTTLSNSATIFNTTNLAFSKANTAFQNTSGTFSGNLSISGTATSLGGFFDVIGSVREKFANTITSNVLVQIGRSVIIANNSGQIYINVDNDNNFAQPANIGSTIEIYQYGPGPTSIRPTSSVTIYSSNNWSNVAGQYLSVSLVKVLPNTWMLTGNLKA